LVVPVSRAWDWATETSGPGPAPLGFGVRLHEAADVDVTLGDDAVEGRHYALIDLVLIEHAQLGGLRLS
jgi:hypothetical protein